MTKQVSDFSGTWRATHWYPTSDDKDEESSVHEMKASQKGDELVLESVPGQDESYMLMRLKIDGDGVLATGSWHESTKMDGPFEGMEYSGAGQLIISKDGRQMQGMWAGAGIDRSTGKPRIYTGRWEFERVG